MICIELRYDVIPAHVVIVDSVEAKLPVVAQHPHIVTELVYLNCLFK